jgi:hypothetical protein
MDGRAIASKTSNSQPSTSILRISICECPINKRRRPALSTRVVRCHCQRCLTIGSH